MMFTDSSYQSRLAKDPAVVRYGQYYFMYYSNYRLSADGKEAWGIGIACSRDLENWEKLQDLEPEGELECRGICAPGAIVLDGKIHLFYQTYGCFERDSICHAWSGGRYPFYQKRNESHSARQGGNGITEGR